MKHPGFLAWREMAQVVVKMQTDVHLHNGEAHFIVTPKLHGAIWHWVSTTLSMTELTPVPVSIELFAKETGVEPVEGNYQGELEWKNTPPPRKPYTVPAQPLISIHQRSERPASPLNRLYPKSRLMADDEFILFKFSPYKVEENPKNHLQYGEQPPDVPFKEEIRKFSDETSQSIKEFKGYL